MQKAFSDKMIEVEFFVVRLFSFDESEWFFVFADKFKYCLRRMDGKWLLKYKLQYKYSEN